MEAAGGVDLGDVRVHAGSPRPARHGADAYAAGAEIFLGPGGADLLAHELWHVVQQRQGRVVPTGRSAQLAVNDDAVLESEADDAAAGRPPAAYPATPAVREQGPVAQFGRKERKARKSGKGRKGRKPPAGPRLVHFEDTSSQDIAGEIFAADEDLGRLMQEAALAALRTYAYHATRSSNAASIMDAGLDPGYGGTGAAEGHETFEEHSKNKIHYTRSVSTAGAYKEYFEGGTPFGASRRVAEAQAAEILQVVLDKDLVAGEQVDADSRPGDRAFTNTSAVPGASIRSLEPTPISPRAGEFELPTLEADDIRHMLRQGAAESSALWSNMSAEGKRLVGDMVDDSDKMTREDVLHMVRQGLHSFRLRDLVDIRVITQLGLLGSMTNKATGQDYLRLKTRQQ